jgi:transmembrane sensor
VKRDPLLVLGAHVAEQQAALLDADAGDEALRRRLVERVLARGASAQPRTRATRWLALAAAVSLLLVGLGLQAWLAGRDTTPHFSVGAGRAGVLGQLEAAPADAALPLRFSDGSVFDLTPLARARVVALGGAGGEVVLESGRARVDIVPRSGEPARWLIRSGPFAVQVKGTSFWLSWDPAAEAFSLELLAGQVSVTGCGLGAGRDVHAGERLEAGCAATSAPAPSAVQREPAVPPEPAGQLDPSRASRPRPAPERSLPERAAPRRAPVPSWQELARQGDFAAAYASAAPGWEARLSSANRDDLLLLGQTARLTGHTAQAEAAYAAVLQRFASSAASARAAFALGLLAFEHDAGQASSWFERCLGEQPSGPLAAAALDRLLEASLRLPDPARRAIAARYVQQYPQGPRAAEAQRILNAASPEPR